MHHNYIDRYANRDSLIHKIDAGVKIFGALILIAALVFTPIFYYKFFLIYALLLLLLILLSKVPVGFVLRNSLVVIPFALVVGAFIPFMNASAPGAILFVNVLVKSWLSALTLLLVSTTTRFSKLLKGMERLKVSKILILILSFMYRYIFVIIDELMRLKRSIEARSFGKRKWLFELKTLGSVIGNLFLRSYERGERVYLAMLARGFTGEIKEIE